MLLRYAFVCLLLGGCAAQCGRLRVFSPDRPMMVGGAARITADRCVPLGKGTFDCDSPQLVDIETGGSEAFRFDLSRNGDDNTFAVAEGRTDATLHFDTGDVVALTLHARDVDHVELGLGYDCPDEPVHRVSAGLVLEQYAELFGDGDRLEGSIDESRFVTIDRGSVEKPQPQRGLRLMFPSTSGPASVRSSAGELLFPAETFEASEITDLMLAAEQRPWRVDGTLAVRTEVRVGAQVACVEELRRKLVIETPETCLPANRAERSFTSSSTWLVGIAPGECRAVISLDDGRFATRLTLTVLPAAG